MCLCVHIHYKTSKRGLDRGDSWQPPHSRRVLTSLDWRVRHAATQVPHHWRHRQNRCPYNPSSVERRPCGSHLRTSGRRTQRSASCPGRRNRRDVLRAMDGVTGAYLCYPVRPGYIQATAYFADAARRAGVEVLVEMSQISAREDSKSHAARNHWTRNAFSTGRVCPRFAFVRRSSPNG